MHVLIILIQVYNILSMFRMDNIDTVDIVALQNVHIKIPWVDFPVVNKSVKYGVELTLKYGLTLKKSNS